MSVVKAPFTTDQVCRLNDWQHNRDRHPFTCGECRDRDMDESIREGREPSRKQFALVATSEGWVCHTCDYTQDWAFPIMVGDKGD